MTVRLFFLAAMIFSLCGTCGCQVLNSICWRPKQIKPPVVLGQNATLEDVLQAVNNNNAKKQTFIADARISVEGAPGSLNSNIAYEYPKKFRAIGETILTKEFDIGSNNELFWVWFKQDPRKAVYFGRHDQYESNPVRDSFQIDPGWLIESLGMNVFQSGPIEEHRLVARTAEGHWKIETKRQTPLGIYTKYTTVDDKTACVTMQELYNPSGQRVAFAVSPNHSVDATTGITYPQTVDMQLAMQGQQLDMRLALGRVQFNQNGPFRADAFTMPNFSDYSMVDICGQSASPFVQQVSGSIPEATAESNRY